MIFQIGTLSSELHTSRHGICQLDIFIWIAYKYFKPNTFKTEAISPTEPVPGAHIELHLTLVKIWVKLHSSDPQLPLCPIPPLLSPSTTTNLGQVITIFHLENHSSFPKASLLFLTLRRIFFDSKSVLATSLLNTLIGFPLYLEWDPNSFPVALRALHILAPAHIDNLICYGPSFTHLFLTALSFSLPQPPMFFPVSRCLNCLLPFCGF